MYDMLPFPNITATDTKEQVAQINNYLIQFKETLEFILTNISADNLSADLIAKLNALGSDIQKENAERGEEMQQVSGRIITASEVVNSAVYKADMDSREEKIQEAHDADINSVREEIQSVSDRVLTIPEIINSEEYQADMDVMELEIQKNVEAKVPTASDVVNAMDLRVNYDTGHLEY